MKDAIKSLNDALEVIGEYYDDEFTNTQEALDKIESNIGRAVRLLEKSND